VTPFWDERVAQWASVQIWGRPDAFENFRAMGVLKKDGTLVAGLVFHNWEPDHGTIEVSGAATDRRWLTRRVATMGLTYAFEACACQMVLARHNERNTPVRKIWVALGADEIRIPRLYGRDADGIIATLTQEAWAVSKFNEVNHGKKVESA
jgi:RimJ/RimL family protein N-acetyltransferase